MKWVLECHRKPAQFIRPREEVFNMGWMPAHENQNSPGGQLVGAFTSTPASSLILQSVTDVLKNASLFPFPLTWRRSARGGRGRTRRG